MSVLPVNGKITRIDTPNAPSSGGEESWSNGAAISVDCTIDEPTRAQKLSLGALLAEVSQVIYVRYKDLPAGHQILQGYRIVANQQSGDVTLASQTFKVVKRELRLWEELSHYELYCKEVAA